MKIGTAVSIAALALSAASVTHAQTTADVQDVLKKLIAHTKANGPAKSAADLTAGTDPNKCKDLPGIGCMIIGADGKMMANAKNPKMVGAGFPPDFADVDGTPIVSQVVGPFTAGKTKWEAKYKFAAAGSKKITPMHTFCEKVDATAFACATLTNAAP